MPRFSYAPRELCPCGAPHAPAAVRRVIPHAWGNVSFVLCPRCGSWTQSPAITADSLGRWYDSDEYQGSAKASGSAYENYERDEPARLAEAESRFSKDVDPWLASGRNRILEIGCASADLLSRIKARGHEALGVDLSPRFARQALVRHGVSVQVADFMDADFPESHFDAVLMFGTASNLSDLPSSFARIRRLLKHDGVLILNYPAADSWIARLYGGSYWMFSPTVASFCTPLGMRLCAERNGFALAGTRIDRQRPSLSKLLKHARADSALNRFLPEAVRFRALPFRVPIPVVRICWFRRVGTPVAPRNDP